MKAITQKSILLGISLMWAHILCAQIPLSKTFDALPSNDKIEAVHIETLANGDLLTCGEYKVSSSDSRMMVMRTNSSGSVKWFKTYDITRSELEIAFYFVENDNGEILVVGGCSEPGGASFSNTATIMKITSDGDVMWQKYYRSTLNRTAQYCSALHIIKIPDVEESYALCGFASPDIMNVTNSNQSGFIMEIDGDGNIPLTRSGVYDIPYDGSTTTRQLFRRIAITENGYAVTGTNHVHPITIVKYNYQALAAQINSTNLQTVDWSFSYFDPLADSRWFGNDLLVLDNDHIMIVGQSENLTSANLRLATGMEIGPTGIPTPNGTFVHNTGSSSSVFVDILPTSLGGYVLSGGVSADMMYMHSHGASTGNHGYLIVKNPGGNVHEHKFEDFSYQMATTELKNGQGFASVGFAEDYEKIGLKITDPLGYVSPDPLNLCEEEYREILTYQPHTPHHSALGLFHVREMVDVTDPNEPNIEVQTIALEEHIECHVVLNGHVQEDLNFNGVYEPALGDYGISGKEIRIVGTSSTYNASTVSDVNGYWSIEVPANNTYEIMQVNQIGVVQTYPSNGNHQFTLSHPDPSYFGFLNHYSSNCYTPEGMVAYLHMEDNGGTDTYNVLGKGKNGTTTNTITSITGAKENTIELRGATVGSSDQIEVEFYQDLDFDKGAWSVEFFMTAYSLPSSNPTYSKLPLISNLYQNSSVGHGWRLIWDSEGQLSLEQSDNNSQVTSLSLGTGVPPGNPAEIDNSRLSTSLSTDWIHVALTVDENEMARFYIDGVKTGEFDFSAWGGYTNLDFDITPHSGDINLAALLKIGDALFDGNIDEVSLYNRALTQGEISLLKDRISGPRETKCWDYTRFNDFTQICNGNSETKGSFTIYNGDLASRDFTWTLAGIDAINSSCNIDGPFHYNVPSGNETCPGVSYTFVQYNYKEVFFEIPCNANNTGQTGCFAASVLNHTDEQIMSTENSADGLNSPNKAQRGDRPTTEQTAEEYFEELPSKLSNEYSVDVYPNPSNQDFIISVYNPENNSVSFELVDNVGRVVSEDLTDGSIANGSSSFVLSGAKLNNGIFFLRVRIGNETEILKLVKTN